MTQKSESASVVSLDIGGYSVKSVELAQVAGKYQLRRVVIFPFQSSASSESGDLRDVLGAALQPFLSRPQKIRISLSGASLLMRRIQMPAMTSAELKSAILFEAESQIPFPIRDCLLDFQVLNTSADNTTLTVLLVAAKKDFVEHRLKILAGLNVLPEVIDADIFCLMNAFEALGNDGGQKTYGLLDIGHKGSSFAILQDRLPFVLREIPVGSSSVTKHIAETKGIPIAEAERLKNTRPEAMRSELRQATKAGYETLIEEISHSVDYFENETGEDLKTIWVSGGGVIAEGTVAFLSEELGKEARVWDNLKKIDVSPTVDRKNLTDHSHELSVALGMALDRRGH